MTSSTQVLTRPIRKRVKKEKFETLSTCPTAGAGWCVYPFSLRKLEKKVKQTKTPKKNISDN